jgi:hypothetical protein
MKTTGSFTKILTRVHFLLFIFTLVSCTSVYFDQPQPVDSKNLKGIPKEIQGKWDHGSYKAGIIIDGSACHFINYEERVFPKSEIGTSGEYKIINDRIFSVESNYNTGFPYEMLNDTIYFTERTEEIIELSDSALLRPAKNCYVFNFRKGDWWEICIIQKARNGEISIYYPSEDKLLKIKPTADFQLIKSTRKDTASFSGDKLYFHAELKSQHIAKMLIDRKEKPLYLLKPDSSFYVMGDESKK